jgi:6,7-dimethyl-8-ribityllumazine synthase
MPNIVSANLIVDRQRFGIVVSRFNEFITSKLAEACVDTLVRHGADENAIDIIWCPGAYEIPFTARLAAQSGNYDAVICLGAVIRGATAHFDYVAGEAAKGIAAVGAETGIPTIFGVLTTDTIEQAIERAGTKAGNKGCDSALAAIEMVNLVSRLRSASSVKVPIQAR